LNYTIVHTPNYETPHYIIFHANYLSVKFDVESL